MKSKHPASSRTRHFEQRLRIEREVLDVINQSGKLPVLTGMTADAIESWKLSSVAKLGQERADSLSAILVSISKAAGTISDNSRAIVSETSARDSSDQLLRYLRERAVES